MIAKASNDRDLADAIHREIIAAALVEYALEVWRDALFMKTWSDADRMKSVLGHVSRSAIDAVLARRQREAARTGPWEGADARHPYRPNKKYPWFCADCGYPEHERLQHRAGGDYEEEDGYPGSLLPRKRGTP